MSLMAISRASSPNTPTPQRVLGIAREDELAHGQGDLLGGGDAVLPVEDHAVADVDEEHRGAGGEVLRLVDLEILLRQGDIVGSSPGVPQAAPLHRVGDGAQRVDLRDGVPEAVRPRLGEALVAVARAGHAVLAEAGLLQAVEDLVEGVLADDLLTLGGERVAALLELLDDLLFLQLPAELLQVHVGVQRSALLQVLHPLEDLVHVPGRHEQEVVEQAHEVLE